MLFIVCWYKNESLTKSPRRLWRMVGPALLPRRPWMMEPQSLPLAQNVKFSQPSDKVMV